MAEHRGAVPPRRRALHHLAKPGPVIDIVAENQRTSLAVDELLADDEGLGDAIGLGLRRIGNTDAPLAAVTEQRIENAALPARR